MNGNEPVRVADIALLEADPLFDHRFYGAVAKVGGTRAELVEHYLAVGEPALIWPSREFDLPFYREVNADVVRSGLGLLTHYLRHWRAERRYISQLALRRDAALIANSGLFDAEAYAWGRPHEPVPDLSAIEDYLVAREPLLPIGAAFDSAFYLRAYPDVQADAAPGRPIPILHYVTIGQAQHRLCNEHELNRRMNTVRARFNEAFYVHEVQQRLPGKPLHGQPLLHYVLTGSRIGLDPAPDFSAAYYLRAHPLLRASGMDPFFHFAAHGHGEGRLGRPKLGAALARGGVMFDMGKPTILVASHEASRTGAPLVGLNLVAGLAARYNVISYLGRPGPLAPYFARHCCLTVAGPLSPLDAEYLLRELRVSHRLSAVLMNSVETEVLATAALQADLPSVALIHEFADYTLPTGRMSAVIEAVDRVMTPSPLVRESLQAELLATRAGPASNIVVRPQGYLPFLPSDGAPGPETPGRDAAPDDMTRDEIVAMIGASGTMPKIVLGAGFVQMRKGVDLFVQTAAALRDMMGDGVRFVWVGDGYAPKKDLTYSIWLADMVRRLDLERHMFFVPGQGSLTTLFALADVFYLPSRLDPFPNVAVDALRAGRGVVCFDRATGIADLFQDRPGHAAAAGAAVPYCDVTQAAAALLRALKPAEMRRALDNAALAEREFDFGDYLAAITEQLGLASVQRAGAMRLVSDIAERQEFDAAFYDHLPGPADAEATCAAIREYVAQGQKGLIGRNPRPGFNEGAARLRVAQPGPALPATQDLTTHRCVVLGDDPRSAQDAPQSRAPLRIAVHLHLHYPELAAEFAGLLASSGAASPLDVVITTTSERKQIEIEHAFRAHRAGSVRVLVGPNRGRNIGPLLTTAGPALRDGGYDVVAHLHGKRSLAVDGTTGDRWRAFLLGTLLGGGLQPQLALFASDPALGLLFAEDRHCVGWTENRPFAEALAARMDPAPRLPEWPIFPIGAMFWARPAAIAPLWALDLRSEDFPPEPAPYDGTVLHAIERMLPAVCEATGHGWCTVHRTGLGW